MAEAKNNNTKEHMIVIDSHDRFVQEFETLLDKINENITNLAQYNKVEMEKPTLLIAEKLNRLKYHRKLLEMMLDKYKNASENEWAADRNEAQDIFKDAHAEWLKVSKELATS